MKKIFRNIKINALITYFKYFNFLYEKRVRIYMDLIRDHIYNHYNYSIIVLMNNGKFREFIPQGFNINGDETHELFDIFSKNVRKYEIGAMKKPYSLLNMDDNDYKFELQENLRKNIESSSGKIYLWHRILIKKAYINLYNSGYMIRTIDNETPNSVILSDKGHNSYINNYSFKSEYQKTFISKLTIIISIVAIIISIISFNSN